MCDFSLQNIRSRPAQVGDKLIIRDFGTGTRGFADVNDRGCAVCLTPGTELAFEEKIRLMPTGLLGFKIREAGHTTAIFRQINKDKIAAHHDSLELPNGKMTLLTLLIENQRATVLQLPAKPETKKEKEEQRRAEFAG